LLTFWLTLFLLSQGIWFLYAAEREGPGQERSTPRIGAAVLPLLARRVETSGPEEAQREVQRLPPHLRNTVTITPAPPPGLGPESNRFRLAQTVTAPDGGRYQLVYVASGGRGPFELPPSILLASAAAGFVFSIGLAFYLTRPLMMLRQGFGRVAQGDLQVRLAGKVGRRGDEISDLARDFDSMAARLEQLLEARDRLLNDVSHELRSPLTRLQLAIGLARQDPRKIEPSLNRIERESEKLEAMVRELLALARAESGVLEDSAEYFDPIAVLESVVTDARFEAQAQHRSVLLALPGIDEDRRPSVQGNAELIRRAMENVVRNAVRFSPPGGTVRVSMDLVRSPLRYRCGVLDEGAGVDPAVLDKLFEPFVRADTRGVGLGLAIAKRAITAHGGVIAARNAAEGGFSVEIELPAVAHGLSSSVSAIRN
jgi:two-component system OmpR family sensor kinase